MTEAPDARSPKNDEEFYVGYLTVPPRVRSFLLVLVPVATAVGLVAVGSVAQSQPDPGSGTWESRTTGAVVGTIVTQPYPMIYATDRGDGHPGFILLVEEGKRGAQPRADALAGKVVRVSGTRLHRNGRRMLEISATGFLPESGGASNEVPEDHATGDVTVRGEIVDGKCYLGAMKPGAGKTHRECAILCAKGGIPLLFVTRDSGGDGSMFLLAGPDGGALDPSGFAYIGQPVQIRGRTFTRGDVTVLRVLDIRPL